MWWLSLDGGVAGLDGEGEGSVLAVAADGEAEAAALAGGWAPGGLPEVILEAVGAGDGDAGNADDAGGVAWGGVADAGVSGPGEALDEGIAPGASCVERRLGAAVGAVGEEFREALATALEADLPAEGAAGGAFEAGDCAAFEVAVHRWRGPSAGGCGLSTGWVLALRGGKSFSASMGSGWSEELGERAG